MDGIAKANAKRKAKSGINLIKCDKARMPTDIWTIEGLGCVMLEMWAVAVHWGTMVCHKADSGQRNKQLAI